jgi:hypothetical protein
VIKIGRRGGRDFTIDVEPLARHLHVVGASGTGKSKFLEWLACQHIDRRHGVCVIDPHGALADGVVAYCASLDADRHGRRIHVVDIADPQWCLGFNPLSVDGLVDPTLRADTMVDTISEVWGGEDTNKLPLLATNLDLVFYALVSNRLTLVEASALTRTKDNEDIRGLLTSRLPDFVYDEYWRDLRDLKDHELRESFGSTRRRLLRFLRPAVRRMVGQSKTTINLRRVMDEGEILIVNLAGKGVVSDEVSRVIGAMLLAEFRLAAMGRTVELGRRHPYYVIVDECYDYLTGDVERSLAETSKLGLHLTLAHQRLGQLRRRSELIYNGVMGGAQTKVVFGGLADEDAEIMAREIMRTTFDLERPKRSLDKPVVVGYERIWLRGYNTSDGYVDTAGTVEGENWAAVSGASAAAGQSFAIDADGNPTPYPVATQEVSGTSDAFSRGGIITNTRARGTTHNAGSSDQEALAPILQTMTTQVHSLEEEVHRAIVTLREQPNQRAIVKLRGQPAKGVTIPTIREALVRPERVEAFKTRVKEQSAYLTPMHVAEAEIEQRRADLGLPSFDEQLREMEDDAPFKEPRWSER